MPVCGPLLGLSLAFARAFKIDPKIKHLATEEWDPYFKSSICWYEPPASGSRLAFTVFVSLPIGSPPQIPELMCFSERKMAGTIVAGRRLTRHKNDFSLTEQ